jgi:hypothetical protein
MRFTGLPPLPPLRRGARARETPHPNGAKVIELIVARGLPVRLSSKPDFSDAVGPGE